MGVGGANQAWTDEAVLNDPKRDSDPRIVLLRNDCRLCGARRGQYCRTSGGYTTLHKSRGKKSMRPVPERRPAPRRGSDTDPDQATVTEAMKRAGGKCESCGDELYGRRGFEYSIHHRKRRSQGGDNRLSNLVVLCGHGTSGCHGSAHKEVAAARLAGLLLRSDEEPAEVPWDHSWRGHGLPDDDGGWSRVEAEFIPAVEGGDPW